ncbi:MAG: hypothetical protein KGL11_01550 [Alphaproteobacteria bacterium]|nr:hypothetical protein [Alphaproteobacteria bacterium]
MTDSVKMLREKAARCWRLTRATDNERVQTALDKLAADLMREADEQDRKERKAKEREANA